MVRSLLGLQGRFVHAGIGVSEADWVHTDLDLAAIAPPLTRICNRYPTIRQYAEHADPLTVAVGVFGYATRSLMERRRELAAQAEEEGYDYPEEARPINAAVERTAPPPPPPAVAPPPAPRQSAQFPTAPAGAPPPPPPSAPPAAPRPPAPGEAPIDPTAVDWQVGRE